MVRDGKKCRSIKSHVQMQNVMKEDANGRKKESKKKTTTRTSTVYVCMYVYVNLYTLCDTAQEW